MSESNEHMEFSIRLEGDVWLVEYMDDSGLPEKLKQVIEQLGGEVEIRRAYCG